MSPGAYGQQNFIQILVLHEVHTQIQYGGPWCSVRSSDFTVQYLVRYTILTQQEAIKVVVISSQMMSVLGMGIFFCESPRKY